MFKDFNEKEIKIYKFLKEININSNPENWEEGYKKFKKENKELKITFKEFENIVTEFLNYYYLISLNYDHSKESFGNFIIREKN